MSPLKNLVGVLVLAVVVAGQGGSTRAAGAAPVGGGGVASGAAGAAAGGLTVLNTAHRPGDASTIWRYYEAWQSDVATVDGKLVTVNIYDARQKAGTGPDGKPTWKIKEAKRVLGSPFPPDDWRQPEFDDSGWLRLAGPFTNYYRSLAFIGLRGKFEVADPSRVGELSLTVKFQGGAVAYLNGQEIGRAGLPTGAIGPTTLADAYPHEAFVDNKEEPIPTPLEAGCVMGASDNIQSRQIRWDMKDQDIVDRFKQRGRSLEVKIPAARLKKGVNVLAVEVHRAPADPILFTAMDLSGGNNGNIGRCWNRTACESIILTAAGDAGAIRPNIARPDGLQVWTESVLPRLSPLRYADPTEPARTLKLCGLRNGAYSGQVVVGSRNSLKGLQATVTDLKQGSATIPATAIQVCYPALNADALNPAPPAAVDPPERLGGGPAGRGGAGAGAGAAAGVIQPVWVIINVPRDAAPGTYTGTLNITVTGEKSAAVPVEMKVIDDWVLPSPEDFTTFMGVHESADSLAMQYNVPLWSEEHWKYLDQAYELLGQIGTKDIYLTAVAKTHLANEQSMVRWIKQLDGTYKLDFSIMERYLDTALKHLHKVQVVCLYIHDYGFRLESAKLPPIVPTVTEFDPKTGKVGEFTPPLWGTPEAQAFWKPVVDGTKALLAKRGLEKSLMFGMASNNWVQRQCCQDLKTMYPDIRWVNRTHFYTPTVGDGNVNQKVGLASVVGGVISIFYDPDDAGDHFGWRAAAAKTGGPGGGGSGGGGSGGGAAAGGLVINFPRLGNVPGAVFGGQLPSYRIFAESSMLSGGARWRSVQLVQGVGHIGADYWPVLKDPRGGPPKHLGDRYVFWHSLSISEVIRAILAPGPDGPVSTTRLQMMRESLQEAEARIFVQNALLDNASAARLGPDLTKRCQDLCDERTQVLRYYSAFCEPLVQDDYAKVFDGQRWASLSKRLYQAAGDVANALGKK